MRAYYSDHFVLPLPEGHKFPMAKYSRLRERAGTSLDVGDVIVLSQPMSDPLTLVAGGTQIQIKAHLGSALGLRAAQVLANTRATNHERTHA